MAGNATSTSTFTSTSTESCQAADNVRHGEQHLGKTLAAIKTLTENVMCAGDHSRELAKQIRIIIQALDVR